MFKKFLCYLIVLFLFGSIFWGETAIAAIIPITVQVDQLKAEKTGWDIFLGAPDPAICIETEMGVSCLPEGTSPSSIHQPGCKDSHTCTFSARVPESEFKISVIDVDLRFNDSIGAGFCQAGQTCDLGRVIVQAGSVEDSNPKNNSTQVTTYHQSKTLIMRDF